jgi:hypothetical protein
MKIGLRDMLDATIDDVERPKMSVESPRAQIAQNNWRPYENWRVNTP